VFVCCRLAVFGDMGVGPHAAELISELHSDVVSSATDADSSYSAVLHLGDFCYNLPDPLRRNWDVNEDWYMAHKQKSVSVHGIFAASRGRRVRLWC
jgi:hypothetical protein